MQFGLPNVTSTVGAEAMHGNHDWNGFITDNETEFVEKKQFYSIKMKIFGKNLKKTVIKIIEKRFKKNFLSPISFIKFKKFLRKFRITQKPKFLGQILQHHTLQSTKYLSKWIEEKNKNNPTKFPYFYALK